MSPGPRTPLVLFLKEVSIRGPFFRVFDENVADLKGCMICSYDADVCRGIEGFEMAILIDSMSERAISFLEVNVKGTFPVSG